MAIIEEDVTPVQCNLCRKAGLHFGRLTLQPHMACLLDGSVDFWSLFTGTIRKRNPFLASLMEELGA